MKKIIEIFLVAAGGLAAVSCTIKEDCEVWACVTLQPAVGAAFKSDTGEKGHGENTVRQLCSMAFNESGKRVFFRACESTEPVSMHLLKAPHSFVSTANIPPSEVEAASASGLEAFLAWSPPGIYDKMLAGDSLRIPMSHIVELKSLKEEQIIEMPLKRLAARIILKSIKNAMAVELKIKGVFLENLVPTVKIDGGSAGSQTQTSEWSAFKGSGGDGGEAQGRAYAINSPLAAGETMRPKTKPLYAFPNDTAQDVNAGSGDEKRKTRMVLSVEFEGCTYYYPVNLDLTSGFSYDVKLVLTHLGSLNPDSFDWCDPHFDKPIIWDDGEEDGGSISITF